MKKYKYRILWIIVILINCGCLLLNTPIWVKVINLTAVIWTARCYEYYKLNEKL